MTDSLRFSGTLALRIVDLPWPVTRMVFLASRRLPGAGPAEFVRTANDMVRNVLLT
jgi:hypothetical protein